MGHLDYAGVCRAAGGVGGDYYDFLELDPGVLGLALADVSGKGMFAGLLVAGLQARIQSIAPRSRESIAGFVSEINRQMHGTTDSNRYATLFYAVWDDETRALSFVNAGHHPPLLLRSAPGGGDETLRLESQGAPVGLLPDASYVERRLELHPGDLLLVYSDGLVEAPNAAGEEFGERRVAAAAREHAGADATVIRDAVVEAVDRFSEGSPAHDDLTLVVARVR
jgi:sigma-B regulation protein RsbU (phosphoserine phosphatase)